MFAFIIIVIIIAVIVLSNIYKKIDPPPSQKNNYTEPKQTQIQKQVLLESKMQYSNSYHNNFQEKTNYKKYYKPKRYIITKNELHFTLFYLRLQKS